MFKILLAATLTASSAYAHEAFLGLLDHPAKIQRLRLVPDKANPTFKRSVTCSVYKDFVIKVVDFGEKGAAQLSVMPTKDAAEIDCQEKNLRDEAVIEKWSGYFYGVKGNYAFFASDDGSLGGGMAFMVYNAKDHKIVFADEAATGAHGILITSVSADSKGLRFNYRRNYLTDCSVITDDKCAAKAAKETGVASTFAKKCKGPYAKLKEEERTTPTYIAYDVEAFISVDAPAWDVKDQSTAIMQKKATPLLKKKSDVVECIPQE